MKRRLLSFITIATIGYGHCQTAAELVKDILPGIKSSLVDENSSNKELEGTTINGKLIFKGAASFTTDVNNTVTKTYKLMISDGTPDGTKLLKDIYPTGNSYIRSFYTFNNLAFFSATAGPDGTFNGGARMWVSDGTADGTKAFKNIDFRNFYDLLNTPNIITLDENRFLFAGDSLVKLANGGSFWQTFLFISNGTESGTYTLKDFNPSRATGPNSNPSPGNFAKLNNGKTVFTASTNELGRELYVTDGTRMGTFLLKDINPGPASMLTFQDGFTTLHSDGNRAYFFANNGVDGAELWSTDGTPEGTKLLKDINPGTGRSSSNNFSWETIGGITYFKASTPLTGAELYQTDGTSEGTKLTLDYQKGASGGLLSEMVQLSNKLIFSASSGGSNTHLVSYNPLNNLIDTLMKGQYYHIHNSNIYCNKLYLDGIAIVKNQLKYPLAVTDGTSNGSGLILNSETPENSTTSFKFYNRSVFEAGNFLLYASDNGTTGLELFKIPVCNSSNTISSIEDDHENSAQAIKVFPNPGIGNFKIEMPAGLNYGLVTITDLSGKTVWRQTMEPNIMEYNTSLPGGIYILNIKNEKLNIHKNISIENH